MVAPNSRVIDVGCDHGLLDVYLSLNKNCSCVATDINVNALSNAIKNIKKYHLEDKIQTVVSDGLKDVTVLKKDTVVIAGMGTHTIMGIVRDVVCDTLIIQSNNDLELLRFYITRLGYYIDKEKVVYERGQYYVIIRFIKGRLQYDEIDYILGPILRKDRFNCDYFQYLYDQCEYVLHNLPNNVVYMEKRKKIEHIKKELSKLI